MILPLRRTLLLFDLLFSFYRRVDWSEQQHVFGVSPYYVSASASNDIKL